MTICLFSPDIEECGIGEMGSFPFEHDGDEWLQNYRVVKSRLVFGGTETALVILSEIAFCSRTGDVQNIQLFPGDVAARVVNEICAFESDKLLNPHMYA